VEKLQKKVVQIMADPAVKERFERTGAFPMPRTPEQFGAFMRDEARRWEPVLKETGIKFD
jgi:tripartite-type tricarboxylate transporter receptor subunit TctC